MQSLKWLRNGLWRAVNGVADVLGLAHYDRQIVVVRPRTSGQVHLARNGDTKTVIDFIEGSCPSLAGTFKPSWWLPNGHFQTAYSVIGNFNNVDKVEYERTLVRLPCGGTLGIDTSPPHHATLPPDAPTIVVAHGLTGGSYESYVRNILEWVVRPKDQGGLGGRGVVANYRGCASVPLTSPQFYSAGYTGDYHTVVNYVSSRYPESILLGVGFSLGASVLARYMGEEGDRCLLSGGIVLGCPWDIPAMSHTLETGFISSRLYSSAMGKNLIRVMKRNIPAIADQFEANPELSHIASEVDKLSRRGRHLRLKDVDECLTCHVGGMRKDRGGPFPLDGADDYYQWASSARFIKGVKRPLLAINAFDDPIIDGTSLPLDLIQQSSHVVLAVTGGGGHLGWFDGPLFHRGNKYPQQRWIVKPVSEFLRSAASSVRKDVVHRRDVEDGDDGWQWVVGSETDTYGKVGWKVETKDKVKGAEESGTLQGL